jgi:cell division protein FtsW (lipid II flippase)
VLVSGALCRLLVANARKKDVRSNKNVFIMIFSIGLISGVTGFSASSRGWMRWLPEASLDAA